MEEGGALYEFAQENPLLGVNMEQMTRMRQTTAFPTENWQTLSASLYEMVDKVLWTDEPVEQIVNDTAAQDQELLNG